MNVLPYIHTANVRQLFINLNEIARKLRRDLRIRFISLRMVAVFAAVAITLIGSAGRDSIIYAAIAAIYLIVVTFLTGMFLASRLTRPLTCFAVLDAIFVACVLYEHILGTPITNDHGLTTAGLVIPFILLSHIGMNLSGRLIIIFSAIVLTAWVTMLGLMAFRHEIGEPGTFLDAFFDLDLGLALSFGFAAISTCLLAVDHSQTRRRALKIDRWRHNLARFFSPLVVAHLQEAGNALDLKRRPAAIMFVDLRDFTSYAETTPASQLAGVLAEYRRLVAGTIFAFGGSVDKFIGDGVMAVFGQPTAAEDDAERALACAVELIALLNEWKPLSDPDGSVFQVGIGLHYGTIIGGVLESGYHDEFTVIGDAVNVAERLESLTKELGASLVVSSALLTQTQKGTLTGPWIWKNAVALSGRRFPIDLAYLPREKYLASTDAGAVRISGNRQWRGEKPSGTAASVRQPESPS
ncbi:adenylate/guanylate cyclase domain-containing protein [Mesorhizobium sp.]|uniref:adenylate/guanylate cyclase domain-containing protein n=1 Tax=Mesorhizobium sp. TaxID=1871066 RepID=UPI000FE2F258|nr:adenylate/guanylate cyclase domain-containing protein [Mesorhizobium sp.]RWO02285.1 MAG: adenylate/guanylate cyclase domain-containing protein [Mesorhizobium sp.]